jgi:hypothetical protein
MVQTPKSGGPSTITLKQASEVILSAPLEIPVALWGDTGVGKTEVIEQIGRQLGIPTMTAIAQITTPVDWMGLPHIETLDGKKYTRFSQPLHLPQPEIHGERGIFFFDELPNATKAVQAAIQSLLTRGEYNGYLWPPGWKQVVAGNQLSHRANTYEMPRPVANRLMHLYVGYDVDTWLEWAAGSEDTSLRTTERSFPSINDLYEPGEARTHSLVRAFLRSNSAVFKSQESDSHEAFATPRTWHYVSHVLKLSLPEDLQMIMFQGLVGPGPAAEFITYLKDTAILPDPRELLTGKATLEKRETSTGRAQTFLHVSGRSPQQLEASQLYAVACSIASAVKGGKERGEKEIEAFFKCLDQFATQEYGVVAVNELTSRLPEAGRSAAFIKWTEKVAGALS